MQSSLVVRTKITTFIGTWDFKMIPEGNELPMNNGMTGFYQEDPIPMVKPDHVHPISRKIYPSHSLWEAENFRNTELLI